MLLDNRCNIDDALIKRLLSVTRLVSEPVLLVLGESSLDNRYQGFCLPKNLLEINPFDFLRRRADEDWTVAVALSARTCSLASSRPAYLTHIIAHELGHARVALQDFNLHAYASWLSGVIGDASGGRITWQYQLPQEQILDRYGRLLAEAEHGDRWSADIQALIRDPDGRSKERFEHMLGLTPADEVAQTRDAVLKFCVPYRSRLEELWTQELAFSRTGRRRLASFAPHIRQFFEESTPSVG